jgi:uncharacterized OB-fold protein
MAYDKPLPVVTPVGREFWNGTKRHELLVQHCNDCGNNTMYPKILCPSCLSENVGWIKSSGKGKIHTFTTICANSPKAFRDAMPYTLAIIELEENVRLLSNIVDCNPEDIKCEMPVEVVFDDVTEEFTLPRFKLSTT